MLWRAEHALSLVTGNHFSAPLSAQRVCLPIALLCLVWPMLGFVLSTARAAEHGGSPAPSAQRDRLQAAAPRASAPVYAWDHLCTPDAGLVRVAQVLLRSQQSTAGEDLRQLLAAHGVMAVAPQVVRLPASSALSPAPRAKLAQRLAAWADDMGLRCGWARDAGRTLLVVDRHGATLSPLNDARPRVSGQLSPEFRAGELVLQTAELSFTRIAVTAETLADGIPWPASSPPAAQVQLLARGAFGVRPVAQRSYAPLANRVRNRLHPHRLIIEQPLAGALNRLRSGLGRLPVRRHRLLRLAAAQHAAAVCRDGRVAHELGAGEDPPARLRALGVSAERVGEVVARSATVQSAFNALLDSPSHLMAMLEGNFTDGGVATARDGQGAVCLVMVLARFPRLQPGPAL